MHHSLELVGAGLLGFAGACLVVMGLTRWTQGRAAAHPATRQDGTVFLFEGQDLIDATPAARRLLRGRTRGASDLARLLSVLAKSYGPDIAERLSAMPDGGRLVFPSSTGLGALEATEETGALRLVLGDEEARGTALDRLSLQAAQEELDFLRTLAEVAPQPIWALDAGGMVVWANRAYLALADAARAPSGDAAEAAVGAQGIWHGEPILAPSLDGLTPGQPRQQRLPLALPGREDPMWFDVTSLLQGPGTLHFALDVGGLVLAESARAQFVQTLAKTFAHLSTGLAIFDRQRRLVLFNPAFMDFTGLSATFLIARPLVHTVLDRLREARIVPEPRDFASWREELAALELAAARGQYCDTWTLPGGQTYRVTGRPHPDGALAFLFEDISGEVGVARRARTEHDTAGAVFDLLEDAIAIFSHGGEMTLANAAYAALWPAPQDARRHLSDEIARWNEAFEPSPIWEEMRDLIGVARVQEAHGLRRTDGRSVTLRLSPLPRGARLVAFSEDAARTDEPFPNLGLRLRATLEEGSDAGEAPSTDEGTDPRQTS